MCDQELEAQSNRRVLFISYAFPPVGGAGVQRVAKFIKYLRGTGWVSSVLTVANPSVPVTDDSLEEEWPTGTVIVRTRTFEPGYAAKQAVTAERDHSTLTRVKASAGKVAIRLFQPDSQVLWSAPAYRSAAKLLRSQVHDAVVVSGPPFSPFVLGAVLSLRFDIPLVLDYRDEWDLANRYWENKQFGPISQALQARLQRFAVRQASALVATTRMSAQALEQIRDAAMSRAQVSCIYNGYDASDFQSVRSNHSPSARFRLVYAGTLWAATSIRPLVDAVLRLTRHRPDVAQRLELVVAGRVTRQEQESVDRLGQLLPDRVVQTAYVPHADAVDLMSSASALCLLLADLPGLARVMPAKTFEYLAARRPILAIVPPGEAAGLLADVPHASVFHPTDSIGLATRLVELVEAAAGGDVLVPETWSAAGFDRRTQAHELAALLSSVCATAPQKRLHQPIQADAVRTA